MNDTEIMNCCEVKANIEGAINQQSLSSDSTHVGAMFEEAAIDDAATVNDQISNLAQEMHFMW